MDKKEFQTERTRIISEMLDNPDKYGIYPTTKCFNKLDELFERICLEEELKKPGIKAQVDQIHKESTLGIKAYEDFTLKDLNSFFKDKSL